MAENDGKTNDFDCPHLDNEARQHAQDLRRRYV
jgi:hypothetical protein